MTDTSSPLPAAISSSQRAASEGSPSMAARPACWTIDEIMQAGVVVIAQAARLVIDHMFKARDLVPKRSGPCRPAPDPGRRAKRTPA